MISKSRSLLVALIATVGLAAPLAATPAFAQTKLKVVLNWKYQGPQGMFFLADDRGYFKAEGIEVQLDQGNGSGGVPALAPARKGATTDRNGNETGVTLVPGGHEDNGDRQGQHLIYNLYLKDPALLD